MEKVQNTDISEVFENDMDLYLNQFCTEQKIEDMRSESQNVWNAALIYIRRHAFNAPGCLKSKTLLNTTGTFTGGVSNYNAYDYDLVNRICDYYIYMCMVYDKEISYIGFSCLTGIDHKILAIWSEEGRKSSGTCQEVGQKLSEYREESLSAKLATAKRNPVGILAILNRHYGWNLPGVSREQKRTEVLTAAELPTLSGLQFNKLTDKSSPEVPKQLDIIPNNLKP